MKTYSSGGLTIEPRLVVHTSHDAFGYLIEAGGGKIVWAPEFFEFPRWATGADLMFAEAAGWDRSIRFRGGAGGHASALDVAREAQRRGVRRLILSGSRRAEGARNYRRTEARTQHISHLPSRFLQ